MPVRGHVPARQDRDSSEELGSPSFRPKFNRHGRPVRNSAGRKKSLPGYIDSAIIEEDMPLESCSSDEEGNPVQPKRVPKRKRSPSPPPPAMDPIIRNEEPDSASESEVGEFHRPRSSKGSAVTLTFNIPLGFHGPLVVKLDSKLLSEATNGVQKTCQLPTRRSRMKIDSNGVGSRMPVQNQNKTGFLTLPPEIRNKIYRAIFVAQDDFKFSHPNNFCVSAAFLRTCRTVQTEGCSILYGENKFVFDRNRATRSTFWESVPKEIGYKDTRQFLKMIGPENLAYLRDIHIYFEDAMPASTPYLYSQEQRRYLNDEYLIDCLRILRQASLRKFTMGFLGRRMLMWTDVKFLGYLEQIKADEIDEHPRWSFMGKIHPRVLNNLIEVMTRKPKLYATKD